MEVSKFFALLVLIACSKADARLQEGYGRFEIKNTMPERSPDSVGVRCKRPGLDLQEVVLYPSDVLLHDFYADERVSDGWSCDFNWYDGTLSAVKMAQEFLVWNKNGSSPYLESCDRCRWKVRESGFYLYKDSKTWTLVFKWNEI
ncbi:hypothetical protein MPTK1_2g03270 [Marchantia polymorpha subsp. ruderalis]|uniref:S-protein homolog n=1 Tax=Marchantia polymorpha TaxID=3197 RepID=A0A2R6WMB2_MARPO|nr:hypothetical protein MARPO_0075s0088 [Marchantia polymorpha]BBN00943.1 hypothetical protein Mp_2g03270 [Marchantia polymorpha subsp. ruderalis]|eukprot:PTQ35000.1 hypothetical protein MARPO_0075s0088 [Marchantia polymorpha]